MAGDVARALVALLGPLAAERESAIAAGLASAHERWPEARPDEAFVGHVADRARTQPDLATALPRLRIDDLVLAWWAGSGAYPAITAFEVAHESALDRLLRRFHRLDADEMRQVVRVKLFSGDTPRIRDYSGFGFLENWFKIIAARTFIDLARAKERERIEDIDDAILRDVEALDTDPRDAVARAQLVAAVKAALEAAIAGLPPRDRTFLRHVMVDGLTLEQIATTYQVHRVTVARALGSARQRLHDATRALVLDKLGIAAGGLASMLQLIDSQIDLSLQRLFPEATR
jgi:RNA polymerase sigma-70 factor (ECF subfamily)